MLKLIKLETSRFVISFWKHTYIYRITKVSYFTCRSTYTYLPKYTLNSKLYVR